MGRRHWHPASCKECGRGRDEVGTISATGLCPYHSIARAQANHEQLKAHSGPFFDHWRRRCLAAFGVAVLDEQPETR